MFTYQIHIEPDGDGFLVTCPDLPEVTTDADSEAEAPERAKDAIEEAIASRLSDFEDIPHPSNGGVHCEPIDPYLGLKVELFWLLQERHESRADLARQLSWHRNSVDRLFAPRHATKLTQFAEAFKALGAKMRFVVEA